MEEENELLKYVLIEEMPVADISKFLHKTPKQCLNKFDKLKHDRRHKKGFQIVLKDGLIRYGLTWNTDETEELMAKVATECTVWDIVTQFFRTWSACYMRQKRVRKKRIKDNIYPPYPEYNVCHKSLFYFELFCCFVTKHIIF